MTLALLSALALAGLTPSAHATGAVGDWQPGGNLGQQAEDMRTPPMPEYGGGWPVGVTGENGGAFLARAATPDYSGGDTQGFTGEAAGSFDRATATPLGGQDGGASLSALRAAQSR